MHQLTLKTSLKNPDPILVMWKSSIRYRVDTAVFNAWQDGAEIFLGLSGISRKFLPPPPGSEIFLKDPAFNESIVLTGDIVAGNITSLIIFLIKTLIGRFLTLAAFSFNCCWEHFALNYGTRAIDGKRVRSAPRRVLCWLTERARSQCKGKRARVLD